MYIDCFVINSFLNYFNLPLIIMTWVVTEIKKKKRVKLHNPVLIEGLPGIGNVAKIAVDFLVQELKAEPIYEFSSNTMPASVFVKDDNLIDLPHVYLYYRRINSTDILFLAGDFQPTEEVDSYEFTEAVFKLFQKLGGKIIITLGGIGLSTIPVKPKVYCTGWSSKFVDNFTQGLNVKKKLYGVVGPIMGAAGMLLGWSKKKKSDAVCFLAETYGHPLFLGINSAKELVALLNKKLDLGVNIKKLEKQARKFEKSIKEISSRHKSEQTSMKETNYIG